MENEDAVSVRVEQEGLAPQVRLIDGITNEVEPSLLELLDGLVDVLDLEMDARAVVDRLASLVQREGRVAIGCQQPGVMRMVCDDLREPEPDVEARERSTSRAGSVMWFSRTLAKIQPTPCCDHRQDRGCLSARARCGSRLAADCRGNRVDLTRQTEVQRETSASSIQPPTVVNRQQQTDSMPYVTIDGVTIDAARLMLSPVEVAQVLRVDERDVRNMIRRDDFRTFRRTVGGAWTPTR